ncbi:uncharacterized protein LOC117120468 [Anneissia japonica]|uniref:uncharacterized protein LOC117120468 n=1 Tax=Anneissia japonica TaxID=1529436 RepID=UPI00142572D8|nr:uncharacterized protein LOC117120468 [Anneissia japonica]
MCRMIRHSTVNYCLGLLRLMATLLENDPSITYDSYEDAFDQIQKLTVVLKEMGADLRQIDNGCIRFHLSFYQLSDLEKFRQIHRSGKLLNMFARILLSGVNLDQWKLSLHKGSEELNIIVSLEFEDNAEPHSLPAVIYAKENTREDKVSDKVSDKSKSETTTPPPNDSGSFIHTYSIKATKIRQEEEDTNIGDKTSIENTREDKVSDKSVMKSETTTPPSNDSGSHIHTYNIKATNIRQEEEDTHIGDKSSIENTREDKVSDKSVMKSETTTPPSNDSGSHIHTYNIKATKTRQEEEDTNIGDKSSIENTREGNVSDKSVMKSETKTRQEDEDKNIGDKSSIDFEVPEVILARGEEALKVFNEELENGKVTVNHARLMVAGKEGVGKTCLVNNLLGKPFNENEPSTDGIVLTTAFQTTDTFCNEWKETVDLDDCERIKQIYDNAIEYKVAEKLKEKGSQTEVLQQASASAQMSTPGPPLVHAPKKSIFPNVLLRVFWRLRRKKSHRTPTSAPVSVKRLNSKKDHMTPSSFVHVLPSLPASVKSYGNIFDISNFRKVTLNMVNMNKQASINEDYFEVSWKANKRQFVQVVIDHASKLSITAIYDTVPETECCDLDGGSLLHNLWKRGDSYGTIAQAYSEFVSCRCYGLTSTSACGACQLKGCENVEKVIDDEEGEMETDDY